MGQKGLKNSAGPHQTAPKEQSDQGLHCLPFHLHLVDALLHCESKFFTFYGNGNYFDVTIFSILW